MYNRSAMPRSAWVFIWVGDFEIFKTRLYNWLQVTFILQI